MDLLTTTVAAVREAGARLLDRYSTASRPADLPDLLAALRANDTAVTEVLRPALSHAPWESDEHATGPIAGGDRWVVDPVGGNVNTVHGMTDWNIGVSLVRDGQPVLAVLYSPPANEMFTATAGGGAFLNGAPLRVSAKTDLAAALVGTGQAKPGFSAQAAERAGASITAMLQKALYVRMSVPVGHQLAQVAAGRMDAHWQYDNVRSHIGPVLLVQEAGGIVTDLDGKPWDITSPAYVAAAPGVHAATLTVVR
ncbi:inositol phosphatase [Paractinoplanes abujensis]|uniref:Myo-inositol-1(Or 4)-monophosphatase n=1 Tax=Paractinoplanes abujensis TaxID=882441 RepID=A0A7W7CSI8_9ACTN|nr:inositol monophosphatase family protein [Actinoplanes abujensis]MBB4693902.1 myo-inositol-1(or 4)-monophosphatase [Actinoplanes abujensis]GID21442.1 inositol phosphatase [Actinoplanes abujensis]